jgi:hypothetical protein
LGCSGQLGEDGEADDVCDAPARDVEDVAQHLVAVAHGDAGCHGDAPQAGRDGAPEPRKTGA